ncbi:recombinase family protein [Streptomyces sp. V3I7]|uniref:recombinase family protein n=1 Tax=Streptomyces sp. V3I7 TaxID=3042278 RepID=UPI0027D809E2|nr:recombinase family protein [Streptomyces sp. V3I7]
MRGRRTARGVIRVAVYLRVSTAKQVEGYGLDTQKKQCMAWLNYKLGPGKYKIHKVYVDGGESGKKDSRPDLDEMTEAIEKGLIDLVVFGKLDRIGRTMEDIHLWVFNATKHHKIRVATADGRLDSDDELFGIMLSLLSYMAELEHTLILERTAGGRDQKLAAGGWPLGQPPYGVMLSGKGSKAVPVLCEDEVQVIDIAASLLVDLGYSRDEAAAHLNNLGSRTRKGLSWTGANLAKRLNSTALDGYVEFRIERTTEEDEEETFEVFRIEVPRPISDPKRVEALRRALNRRSFKKKNLTHYLFTGRLHALCGGYYTGGKPAESPIAYYRCMGKRLGLKCECTELPAPDVEKAIWTEVEALLSEVDKFRALAAKWLGAIPARAETYRKRLAELDAQIEKKRASRKGQLLEKLTQIFEDELGEGAGDGIDEETIREVKQALQAKEDELIAERDRLARWLREAEEQQQRADEIVSLVEERATEMDSFTPVQRRDLLDLLDIRVQVTGKGQPHRKGIADPLTEWHRETGTLVPLKISDGEWARVDAVLPDFRQTGTPKREMFEAILWKLRTAAGWSDVRMSGNSWGAARRRAEAWRTSGAWEAAMEALKRCGGVPVPPLMVLPPMEVWGSIDPRFTALELEACESEGDGCNQNHTHAQSSGSSSRSCSWCCSPTCSADPCRSEAAPARPPTPTS